MKITLHLEDAQAEFLYAVPEDQLDARTHSLVQWRIDAAKIILLPAGTQLGTTDGGASDSRSQPQESAGESESPPPDTRS